MEVGVDMIITKDTVDMVDMIIPAGDTDKSKANNKATMERVEPIKETTTCTDQP
ncbi:hypothetical protein LOTGIDRAFT_208020 [Lottia gigantea]|uniref:Uncharacterized protein n=1 Tax=Lottia gigantea TaxID=225164 RepID=V4ALM3_LOTGI|nr:hypothetical protein LOTGIDRAFT_208020 [Lottia gigantea]ESP05084.1 hypothetical protein LOTGIDRAFT_208020 [Lottia gigantea]